MSFKTNLLSFANKLLRNFGARIIKINRNSSHEEDSAKYTGPSYANSVIPENVKGILQNDNNRLSEIRQKYRNINHPATKHSFWGEKSMSSKEFDLIYFRGDNLFLWQFRSVGSNAHLKYILYTYYIIQNDYRNLLSVLDEDELFGVYIFDFNSKYKISRDLLDSISEIYFLDKYLNIFNKLNLNILDIGAGYGRLAYRMTEALNEKINKYFCVDAIAESTFLCEFYLNFRKPSDQKAVSVPLYDIEKTLEDYKIDIAINIHSFTECTYSVIKWWLELVRKNKARYLFIIPNPNPENKLLSVEENKERIDFQPLIESLGYKLIQYKPKFDDSTLQAVFHHLPVYYYLFELEYLTNE